MARSYTTTINVKCWKEHTCVSCGAVHAYQFVRKVQGRAPTAEGSKGKAQANVQKTLATQVDLQPCPGCGIYQPDMIGQQRIKAHRVTLWLTLIACIILLILRACDVLQSNVASWLLAGVGAVASMQLVGRELRNPNADPQKNLGVAAQQVEAGNLKFLAGQAADAAPQWVRIARSAPQTLAPPVLLVGVLLIAGAELARLAFGWPLNTAVYPPVVGPGDQTRIYMAQKIESLDSYWRGTAKVTLTPADSQDSIDVDATTNQNDWDQTIHVDTDKEHENSTPWVIMHLPADASLASKTVDCDVQIEVQYPQKSGEGTYDTHDDTMEEHVTLRLASAGAGRLYNTIWWTGGIGGFALILGANLALISAAKALQRKANPTRILQPAAAA